MKVADYTKAFNEEPKWARAFGPLRCTRNVPRKSKRRPLRASPVGWRSARRCLGLIILRSLTRLRPG
eukprot:14466403-Alexandrium_andersonii.AAC.1